MLDWCPLVSREGFSETLQKVNGHKGSSRDHRVQAPDSRLHHQEIRYATSKLLLEGVPTSVERCPTSHQSRRIGPLGAPATMIRNHLETPRKKRFHSVLVVTPAARVHLGGQVWLVPAAAVIPTLKSS
jgi:hypothetical protein